MAEPAHVTAAEIARIAQVSRATVSNWRRRHDDFPQPVGGTENRPTFDRAEVEAWLKGGNRLPELTHLERLWRDIQLLASGADLPDVLAGALRLLRHLTSDGGTPALQRELQQQDDAELAERVDTLLGRATRAQWPRGLPSGANPAKSDLLRHLVAVATTPEDARQAAEDLIHAYQRGQRGRLITTPQPLATLMVELAEPQGGDVLDPACGLGTILLAAAEHGAGRLFGQESAGPLARLAEARLAITGHADHHDVRAGDSLHADAHRGQTFDAVLCDPPFNQRDWGAERLAYDERWEYGVPPRSESELAWLQHCLAHTRVGGKTILLMPPTATSRGSGRRIRAELLRRGALRAVVSLPPGAAQPAHIGLHLWLLERPDPRAPLPSHVLLVDTSPESADTHRADPRTETRQPIDWTELNRLVREAWRDFQAGPERMSDIPGLRRAVALIDLLDQSVDLTPARHLTGTEPGLRPEEALDTQGRIRRRLAATLRRVSAGIPGAEWAPRDPADTWRLTTVADLSRAGALLLHRASATQPGAENRDEAGNGPAVLTLADVRAGTPPSGRLSDPTEDPGRAEVEEGDVVVPALLTSGTPARVATATDAGALLGRHLHLLRPDPTHIDPWFLAGFLSDPANLRRASYGTTTLRVDVRHLRIALLPLEEQRAYGRAFRKLHEFNTLARHAAEQADELTEHLATGLRSGALRPLLDSRTSRAQSGQT